MLRNEPRRIITTEATGKEWKIIQLAAWVFPIIGLATGHILIGLGVCVLVSIIGRIGAAARI